MSVLHSDMLHCQHIKPDQSRCQSPAPLNRNFCDFHAQWHAKQLTKTTIGPQRPKAIVPLLKDLASIEYERNEVKRMLATKMIDKQTGELIMHALQMAQDNLKWISF
jgi:hypothetical protein